MKNLLTITIIIFSIAGTFYGRDSSRKQNRIVFEGTVLKIGKPPDILCGVVAPYRIAKYKIDRIIEGEYDGSEIIVHHLFCNRNVLENLKEGDRVVITINLNNPPAQISPDGEILSRGDNISKNYAAEKVIKVEDLSLTSVEKKVIKENKSTQRNNNSAQIKSDNSEKESQLIKNKNFIKSQKTEDDCRDYIKAKNVRKGQIVCISSKELIKRIVFINNLYAPSTANLTGIKNKIVFVDILINKEGKVTEVIASKGHPALTPLGIVIASKAKFTPVKIDGKPRKMYGKLVLTWNPEKLDRLN